MFLFTRKYAIIWFIAVTALGLDYGVTMWFTMYPTEEVNFYEYFLKLKISTFRFTT